MRVEPRRPTTATVFDELALRMRQMVRDIHLNELSGVERFAVQRVNPFVVSEVGGGELVLEDGDPDFTIGETLRARITANEVALGDLVWLARQDGEWHAFDVVSA